MTLARWIDIGIAVVAVLVCAVIVGRMVWANVKLNRHLKVEDEKWDRAMKQLHDEAAERKRKK